MDNLLMEHIVLRNGFHYKSCRSVMARDAIIRLVFGRIVLSNSTGICINKVSEWLAEQSRHGLLDFFITLAYHQTTNLLYCIYCLKLQCSLVFYWCTSYKHTNNKKKRIRWRWMRTKETTRPRKDGVKRRRNRMPAYSVLLAMNYSSEKPIKVPYVDV